jgi:hypothetical protein
MPFFDKPVEVGVYVVTDSVIDVTFAATLVP